LKSTYILKFRFVTHFMHQILLLKSVFNQEKFFENSNAAYVTLLLIKKVQCGFE